MKFRVADPSALAVRLRATGAIEAGESRHEDLYLAHPGRDFAATDEALRLRRVDDENRITYKGPKRGGPTKTREEIEVPFAPGEQAGGDLATLLERLGFRRVALVAKSRRAFSLDLEGRHLEVVIDRAEGLGCFAEVEALAADEADLPGAQEAVMALATSLGLDEVEPRSYLRMTLERAGTR